MPPLISRGSGGRRDDASSDHAPPGQRLIATDEPGFREVNGYDNYGDPWQEQRYCGG